MHKRSKKNNFENYLTSAGRQFSLNPQRKSALKNSVLKQIQEIPQDFRPEKTFTIFNRQLAKIATAAATLVLLFGGAVAASAHSLPGSALYPLKIAGDKIQLALTFTPEQHAKVQVKIANERLAELDTLQSQSSGVNEQTKTELKNNATSQVKQAIQNLSDVKTNLEQKHDQPGSQEINNAILQLQTRAQNLNLNFSDGEKGSQQEKNHNQEQKNGNNIFFNSSTAPELSTTTTSTVPLFPLNQKHGSNSTIQNSENSIATTATSTEMTTHGDGEQPGQNSQNHHWYDIFNFNNK